MAAPVAPEKMWPSMATILESETNLLATAAPPSGVPPSSWASSSKLKPLNWPASLIAIFAAWAESIPYAALSPVMGPPMPILTVLPALIVRQPSASDLQASGWLLAAPQADNTMLAMISMAIVIYRRLIILSPLSIVGNFAGSPASGSLADNVRVDGHHLLDCKVFYRRNDLPFLHEKPRNDCNFIRGLSFLFLLPVQNFFTDAQVGVAEFHGKIRGQVVHQPIA